MKLLAVDTSGTVCGVAILTEDGIRHECAVMNHKTHSVNLLPMIDNAFQSTGLTIQDMDRLAVVVGPGSFTGVRYLPFPFVKQSQIQQRQHHRADTDYRRPKGQYTFVSR